MVYWSVGAVFRVPRHQQLRGRAELARGRKWLEHFYAFAPIGWMHEPDAFVWRLSDICLSRTSGVTREQRGLGRLNLAQTVAHVTRDSDTTFKVKRSKVNLEGRGHIVAASRTACYVIVSCASEISMQLSVENHDFHAKPASNATIFGVIEPKGLGSQKCEDELRYS